jgi:hypothetical protein
MLAYASPFDDRMRGTLRMYGAGPGRWSGSGPQLQNLKKNESGLPLSVVDSIRAGDHNGIAQYGNPLALLGDVSRASLCASPGMELKSGDFSAVESVVLAFLAGERWKLVAYKTFLETGDTQLEPYRVIARKMLGKPADAEIASAERNQIGKPAELASGFGGSIGAWRRLMPNDPRSDEEIKAIIKQWRDAHRGTRISFQPSLRTLRPTSSSWTMPAVNGNRIAAGSGPSLKTSSRASREICSRPRSSASKAVASMWCFIVMMKSRSRFRSDRFPTTTSATSC